MRPIKIAAALLGGAAAVIVLGGVGLWLAHRAPDIPLVQLEQRFADAQSHYVDLGDGVRIHYRDQGRRDGPPLVLVHGFGDNSFSWQGWVDRLGQTYRVLSVDLPGHGLTDAPATFPADPGVYAELVSTWASRIGLKRFALAGNSLGGAVAWQLALKRPDQVADLILADAAGWPADTRQQKKKLPLAFRIMQYRAGRALLASIDNTPLIREGLKKNVADPSIITEPFVERWAAFQRAPGHRTILMSLTPGTVSATPQALSTIRAPTLILWGADDPLITVASARKFARAIPGSQLIIYPHVGHLPQIEVPDRSAKDVAGFLERNPVR